MKEESVIDNKKIGSCIKKIRMQKGISQIELAKAINVSQTHMSNIEHGNAGLSLCTAVKIARVLNCSIDQFADENRMNSEAKTKEKHLIDIADLAEALKIVALKNKLGDEHLK